MSEPLNSAEGAKEVARSFLRMYYKILNDYTSYLYKFYDHGSRLKVSETLSRNEVELREESTLSGIRNLLVSVYDNFSVMPSQCHMKVLPDGSIELHLKGTMFSPNFATDKDFEQTVTLGLLDDSFYVQSDELKISRSPPAHSISFRPQEERESKRSPMPAGV